MTPDGFTGTAADLLKALNDVASETQQKAKGWPKRPAGLGSLLRRIAPPLRKVGIEITFVRTPGGKRTRTITIARKEGAPDRPDRPDRPTAQDINDIDRDGRDANFHTQTSKGTEVICAHCGRPGGNEVAFGDEIGPVWLHRECEAPWIELACLTAHPAGAISRGRIHGYTPNAAAWHQERRADAIAALTAMGVRA
jgi:hypothetical protein